MTQIRPISDLRNNFKEISQIVHDSGEPVFLTKNGYGSMVVMSIESYDKLKQELDIYNKLKEASKEANLASERYDFNKVADETRKYMSEKL